ncbi:MAG: peptidase S41 [Ignavibacteriae bacterium]|nr:MAG: peptidase S41 [Ignavibacteriota bacterium]
MIKTLRIILMLIVFTSIFYAQEQTLLCRFPDINKDGSKIVFSYSGDLWVVPSKGGRAERITIHEAYETNPFWSKDDNKIAFSSNRYGNNDIFIIPSNGGTPTRLTYHSANDNLTDFATDNTLLFSTARNFKEVEWDQELNFVSANGGTPHLLLDATGKTATKSPDNKFIALSIGWGRVTREAYKGSANYDIWTYDIAKKSFNKLTDFDGHDLLPRWADSKTLYFISSRNGKYNLYKMNIDDKGRKISSPEQITNFEDNGIRYFNVSGNGKFIVFEKGTNIYLLNLSDNSISKVNIEISSDYRFDPVISKNFSNKMDEYSVSPNGKYTAFVVRGEIFLTENNKEKNKTINLTNHPYRDQDPAWLNDSTLIFISDREGQKDLYMLTSSDNNESNIFKSLKHKTIRITDTPENESSPVVSPDRKSIVYQLGIGELIKADLVQSGKLSNSQTILDGWATPKNISWSPDSKWLAYSLSDLYFNNEIYIYPLEKNAVPINVSMHPRNDFLPVWSKDGSKLGFVSQRKNNNFDIWFVWLKKDDWEKTQDDWDEYEESKEDKKDKDSTKVKTIEIDTENIFERLVQVTSLDGDQTDFQFSDDGETIYFRSKSPTKKGSDIFSIKWNGKDIKELTSSGSNLWNLKTSDDGNYLFYNQKGMLNRLDLKSGKNETLPFNAKMEINFSEEKKQKFEESWRALRDKFYDPNFHGQNWDSLKSKYKPWCMAASTDQDFADMYNIMLGQVNASHMGMKSHAAREQLQNDKTGMLGISIEQVENGIKVIHIIDTSPADKNNSRLKVNDIIKAVNGNPITKTTNFYSLLNNKADQKILLNVERKGKDLEIAIRPTTSLRKELYNQWVERNRKLVDKFSKGKLGYLHIQAMGWNSFERFEREFTARAHGKEGIVIDVRFNGGGWITDYLMTVLNYKQHAYTIPRGAAKNLKIEKNKFREYYPLGERLPYSAWTKPSIVLCNQNSYSNAEIFSHAYKHLGIGKLIGVPTFGAVISTGGLGLIDGSFIRLPFRGWFVKADNSNMDLVPAVPDIIVENSPNAKTTENDLQLKKAVEELLKEL